MIVACASSIGTDILAPRFPRGPVWSEHTVLPVRRLGLHSTLDGVTGNVLCMHLLPGTPDGLRLDRLRHDDDTVDIRYDQIPGIELYAIHLDGHVNVNDALAIE